MNKELAVALMRLAAAAAGVSATPYLERLALHRIGMMNKAEGVMWVHHNIATRARVYAWVRPRVTKGNADLRRLMAGRSAEALRIVSAETWALTRIGNRSGRATDSGLHKRINERAEWEREEREARRQREWDEQEACSHGFRSPEEMWDFDDSGKSIWNQ